MRLEQIVGNLVSNALKFTPRENRVSVSVTVEGPDAALRVADEGMGISPDVLPHIFDLFVQADVATDRSKGGLGIGLTLVRRLVELHGGTVEAASKGKGHGATFHGAASRFALAGGRRRPPIEHRAPASHRSVFSWWMTTRMRARCTPSCCGRPATTSMRQKMARPRSRCSIALRWTWPSSTSACRAWMDTNSRGRFDRHPRDGM